MYCGVASLCDFVLIRITLKPVLLVKTAVVHGGQALLTHSMNIMLKSPDWHLLTLCVYCGGARLSSLHYMGNMC